jgi:hypothetical protein
MDVKHDAASLYRFVDSVCSSCHRTGVYPAYLESNRSFIDYVYSLGDSTKRYLLSFPEKLARTPASDYNVTRQELWNLRSSWFELHRRLKPASDADTLHLPYPLIRALVSRLHETTDFRTTRFVVIHTERLNYLQVTASSVETAADNIAGVVGHRRFHRDLGMIGIPYSQSGSLFLNCLLAHEIGHYVFDKKQIATRLAPKMMSALAAAFPSGSRIGSSGPSITNALADWAEELFCDLFAIRLVGPCFSYAFIEIFDLVNDLDASGALFPSAAAEDAKFSASHPADLFRLKQHVSLLENLGWWGEIGTSGNLYMRLLSLAKSFPDSDFKIPVYPLQAFETNMLHALRTLMVDVITVVRDVTVGVDDGVQEYRDLRVTMEEYFKRGIVPSSIRVGQNHKCPQPITILNVAYKFYLDDLDDLVKRIKDGNPQSIKHRQEWAGKVEMWAMKAIDDYLLLNKVKGV